MVKGQASMEYMLIFGFSLVIVGILWVTSSSNIENTQWELQLAYGKNSVARIAQMADSVYIQGEPAQMQITVYFPENTRGIYIQDNSITIEMLWKGVLRNVTSYSIANLTGSLNPGPGQHNVILTAGTAVTISE